MKIIKNILLVISALSLRDIPRHSGLLLSILPTEYQTCSRKLTTPSETARH